MSAFENLTRGLFKENPVFRLLLGMCPTLAVTTEAVNGLGMGLATTFVLICSNVVVSLLRNVIPAKVRIPCFIVIIATFVTIVDLVMNAYLHDMHKTLGVFIPLIVVNCVILGRAEAFASRNNPIGSLLDGIGMGLGFTGSLILLGSVRELFGNGTIFGASIFGAGYNPVIVMILPPGAFITLGILLAIINRLASARSAS
ncbi:MAG: electron transport complex subunit RsxE [Deltaproteobacteria bacterium]|nr:MAG: electron transport complex subunit RsxE [Deltaproteobacteria bacterium]